MKFNNILIISANNNKHFDHNRIIINVYKICLKTVKNISRSKIKHVLRTLKNYIIIGINKIKKDLHLVN